MIRAIWLWLASLLTFLLGLIFGFFSAVDQTLLILRRSTRLVKTRWSLKVTMGGGSDNFRRAVAVFTWGTWTWLATFALMHWFWRIWTAVHAKEFWVFFNIIRENSNNHTTNDKLRAKVLSESSQSFEGTATFSIYAAMAFIFILNDKLSV